MELADLVYPAAAGAVLVLATATKHVLGFVAFSLPLVLAIALVPPLLAVLRRAPPSGFVTGNREAFKQSPISALTPSGGGTVRWPRGRSCVDPGGRCCPWP